MGRRPVALHRRLRGERGGVMTAAPFTHVHVNRLAMRPYLDALWGSWDDPSAGVLPFWDATETSKVTDFLPIHDLDACADRAAQHVEQGWSGHIAMALQPKALASGRGKEETTI